MLNRGKGPAVHSLRVQTDRKRYHMWMKHALEKTPNLDIHQAEVIGVDVQDGKITGIITSPEGAITAARRWSLPPAPPWAGASLWARPTTTAAPTAPTPPPP